MTGELQTHEITELAVCLLVHELTGIEVEDRDIQLASQLAAQIAKDLDSPSGAEALWDLAESDTSVVELGQSGKAIQIAARHWIYRFLDTREESEAISSAEVLESLGNTSDITLQSRIEYARVLVRYDTLLQHIGGMVTQSGLADAESGALWPNEYPPPRVAEFKKPELDIHSIASELVNHLSTAPDAGLRVKDLRQLVGDVLGETGRRWYSVETTLRATLTLIERTMDAEGLASFVKTETGYRKLSNPDLAKAALERARQTVSETKTQSSH